VRSRIAALTRRAKLLLVLGVLAASAVAFAVSEGLKVQRAAVTDVNITHKVFSPVCRCESARAGIGFRLTRSDRVTLSMLDGDDKVVRVLVQDREFGSGRHHFTWNGRNSRGRVVPEGDYRPRVRLGKTSKTYDLPNPIQVDVTKPKVVSASLRPRVISPDGDGHSDTLRVDYRMNERAHAVLFVGRRQEVRTRSQRQRDTLNWSGKRGGKALPPGRYLVSVAAEDIAGNRSRRADAGVLRVRYVQLATHRIVVAPRGRIRVTVSTDAPRVNYVIRRGASISTSGRSGRRVSVRAPAEPGRYVLTVGAAGHFALAAVVVQG
jgi:hypothetical protein